MTGRQQLVRTTAAVAGVATALLATSACGKSPNTTAAASASPSAVTAPPISPTSPTAAPVAPSRTAAAASPTAVMTGLDNPCMALASEQASTAETATQKYVTITTVASGRVAGVQQVFKVGANGPVWQAGPLHEDYAVAANPMVCVIDPAFRNVQGALSLGWKRETLAEFEAGGYRGTAGNTVFRLMLDGRGEVAEIFELHKLA